MSEAVAAPAPRGGGLAERALAWVERAGNRVPSPAILFLGLIIGVIVLSQVLDWLDVGVSSLVADPSDGARPSDDLANDPVNAETYELATEQIDVQGLLTADGIRFMFTSFVPNFLGFAAVGVILVAMIGVGVAEYSGLVGALIRKLVAISTPGSLTYIIVFVGIVSSVASDAGYLVLIPLAAVAFISVGRHPLAGIAAAFGAVSAAFGVNVLITPADGVVTDIANESARLVDPGVNLDLVANLWYGIASTVVLTIVIGLITTRIVEPRLGTWDRGDADPEELEREEGPEIDADAEARGPALGALRAARRHRRRPAPDAAVRRAAAQPGDGRRDRRLPVHEQPDRDHLGDLPRRPASRSGGPPARSGAATTRSA